MNEMKNQPEALRLADKYEVEGFLQDHRFAQEQWCSQAAVELRRLHAENQSLQSEAVHNASIIGASAETELALRARVEELERELAAIGAGGVEPLRKRAATADLAARQREMQLLGEIEALERLALNVLKQLGVEATPIAWYVTGCSTMLDECEAKAEAKRCGGSAKAVPLYAAPPAHADALRLAVQHGLEICRGHDATRGEFVEVFYLPRKYAQQKSCIEYFKDNPDPLAATRRAIVRAASSIEGKAQP